MKLTDLELRGYGHFGAEHKGGFVITTPNLPALWDYITIRKGSGGYIFAAAVHSEYVQARRCSRGCHPRRGVVTCRGVGTNIYQPVHDLRQGCPRLPPRRQRVYRDDRE
jgi:hypothetical protein